jgi:hypothetical protein
MQEVPDQRMCVRQTPVMSEYATEARESGSEGSTCRQQSQIFFDDRNQSEMHMSL